MIYDLRQENELQEREIRHSVVHSYKKWFVYVLVGLCLLGSTHGCKKSVDRKTHEEGPAHYFFNSKKPNKKGLVNDDPKTIKRAYYEKHYKPTEEGPEFCGGELILETSCKRSNTSKTDKYLIRVTNNESRAYSWTVEQLQKLKETFSGTEIEVWGERDDLNSPDNIKRSDTVNGVPVYNVPLGLITIVGPEGTSSNIVP